MPVIVVLALWSWVRMGAIWVRSWSTCCWAAAFVDLFEELICSVRDRMLWVGPETAESRVLLSWVLWVSALWRVVPSWPSRESKVVES